MVGLPGTGKSTLSRALIERFGGFVIDKDIIRPALFGPTEIEYTVAQDDFCQEVMIETAAYLLKGKPRLRIFLDGRPFSREYQRTQVREAAGKMRALFAVIHCIASDEIALARIESDFKSGAHLAANRTPKLYFEKKRDFEREPLQGPRLTISSDQDLEKSIADAEAYLRRVESV